MSVSPDHRAQALRRFIGITRLACVVLLLLGIAYMLSTVGIVQNSSAPIIDPELQTLYIQRTILLRTLTGLQVAGCALLLFSFSRPASPFSPCMVRCLGASGVLSIAKAIANAYATAHIASLYYEFAGPLGPIQLRELALETFDIPSVLLGVAFLVFSAAFSYSRELFIDSEEMV